MTERVWYAAYGSNTSLVRFRYYLEGGKPPEATGREFARCQAGTDIAAMHPFALQHVLYFAHRSSNWDNAGVALVELATTPGTLTLARAYLLSIGQLEHLASEENARQTITLPVIPLAGLQRPHLIADHGWYRYLVPCGTLDGRPVVTLTGPASASVTPGAAYHRFVHDGIRETYPDMSEDEIRAYIDAAKTRSVRSS